MSFGLSRGKQLDTTGVGREIKDLPPIPDDVADNPEAAWIDFREWFGDPARRFEIEIGSGKGTFLVQQAALEPETNFLGIEWAGEFYRYAADRVRRNGLENVKMLRADASEIIKRRTPTGIVRVVHLYFSDPWPKKRHHKRRVVQDDFLRECHRVLAEEGELRIVTDHSEYWAWMNERFDALAPRDGQGLFTRAEFRKPESAGEGEVVGTNFERKYKREGRPFHSIILKKNA
jgi:tRNA (guanine-N7-)-methyltransferase